MTPDQPSPPVTVAEALNRASALIEPVSDTARLDAEILLRHVTGWSAARLLVRHVDTLDSDFAKRFELLSERRARGEPVAYLTGEREFWSLVFCTGPEALIPRPDTETLVERALTRIPEECSWEVLDLGAGTGNVAVSLARERPNCRIVAVDVDPRALSLARLNAERLDAGNVSCLVGDWFEPVADRRFNLIVGNPPYVADQDPHLAAGDVRFEPRRALSAGPEGLDEIIRIASAAPTHLDPDGWLLLEHGADQGEAVREIFESAGLVEVSTIRDLGGRDRVTEGRR